MTPPKFLGKIVYFLGHPIFRLLIRGTTRAYVAVCVDDEILLTQNWLGSQVKWRLAGGGVHAGEIPLHAACRELKEELGISAKPDDIELLTAEPLKAQFRYEYYLFVYKLQNKPKMAVDNREILRAQFISKKDIKEHHLSEESTAVLKLLGWL